LCLSWCRDGVRGRQELPVRPPPEHEHQQRHQECAEERLDGGECFRGAAHGCRPPASPEARARCVRLAPLGSPSSENGRCRPQSGRVNTVYSTTYGGAGPRQLSSPTAGSGTVSTPGCWSATSRSAGGCWSSRVSLRYRIVRASCEPTPSAVPTLHPRIYNNIEEYAINSDLYTEKILNTPGVWMLVTVIMARKKRCPTRSYPSQALPVVEHV